jgi:AcrR family transcriptional regulator
MDRIATRRPYRSALREEQSEQTRDRILQATVHVMARGLATLSVPAVAREARVSVPTIYRYFATKDELLAAVYPYLQRRAGLGAMAFPTSVEGLRQAVVAIFANLDAFDDLARAAMASPAAVDARRASMPTRLAIARRMSASIEAKLSDLERERLARLLVILTSSSALRMWRDNFESSVDEAADDIDWIVRSVVKAAEATS